MAGQPGWAVALLGLAAAIPPLLAPSPIETGPSGTELQASLLPPAAAGAPGGSRWDTPLPGWPGPCCQHCQPPAPPAKANSPQLPSLPPTATPPAKREAGECQERVKPLIVPAGEQVDPQHPVLHPTHWYWDHSRVSQAVGSVGAASSHRQQTLPGDNRMEGGSSRGSPVPAVPVPPAQEGTGNLPGTPAHAQPCSPTLTHLGAGRVGHSPPEHRPGRDRGDSLRPEHPSPCWTLSLVPAEAANAQGHKGSRSPGCCPHTGTGRTRHGAREKATPME